MSSIVIVVGLNHKTAPIALREQLALSAEAISTAYATLHAHMRSTTERMSESRIIDEIVILSTCNRFEVYATATQAMDGIAFIEQFFAQLHGLPVTRLASHMYRMTGEAAAEHAMRVACGLDSMILGESQILGQVSAAFEAAHSAGMTGAILSHLFAQALHAGKRARSETAISRFSTSVSHVGVQALLREMPTLPEPNVLVIGAGEMASLAAQAVRRSTGSRLTFINRTFDRAAVLAEKFTGQVRHWFELEQALIQADAVICATGAPHAILYADDIERVMRQRGGSPVAILDIAMPRDVDPSANDIPGVTLFDIDMLHSTVEANLELRHAAVPAVERIIAEALESFTAWYASRHVTPIIRTLREWAQTIADDELDHTLNRLSDADDRTREIVALMAHRLVNRLLHEPTSRLRQQASAGRAHGYAHAVRELFALETLDAVECQHSAGCAFSPDAALDAPQCTLHCILPRSMEPRQ